MRFSSIAAALILILSAPADADSTSPAVPTVIQVNANGAIRFQLGGVTMCSSASSGTTVWGDIQVLQGGVTTEAHRAMLSLLVSAKLAGKPVKVYASNGGASQWGCLVTAVEVQ